MNFSDQSTPLHLEALTNAAKEAIIHVDDDWIAIYCNDCYLEYIGLPRAAVIGKSVFDFFPNFGKSIFFEAIERCRVSLKPTSMIGSSRVLGGMMLMRVFPVPGGGMMMFANDATSTLVKQYQLAQQAVKDPLTGLGQAAPLLQA